MLVLSRKTNEKLRITLEDGRQIVVVVVEVRGDKVRIGVEADRTIRVDREEIAISKAADLCEEN